MRKTDKYTFFYGTSQCFSNWHPSIFKDDNGIEYNCSEQWMMACKARLFGDESILEEIMSTRSPRIQKEMGRRIKNFNSAKWDAVSRDLVYEGLKYKFTQNPSMLSELFSTRGTTLAEAAPDDKLWGIGMGENEPGIEDPSNWKGKNWLGETLTKLRDDFIKEDEGDRRYVRCLSNKGNENTLVISEEYELLYENLYSYKIQVVGVKQPSMYLKEHFSEPYLRTNGI